MAPSRSPDADSVAGRSAEELVAAAALNRPALKRLATAIDAADQSVKVDITTYAAGIGIDLPPDAPTWPAKRLLRLAMGRQAQARRRRNPIMRDEAFHCEHCGADVTAGGRTVRDHCPQCLRSLHVDVVPGDRSAGCNGVMHPVGLSRSHGDDTIQYRCARCGASHQVVVHPDDDPSALRSVVNPPPT